MVAHFDAPLRCLTRDQVSRTARVSSRRTNLRSVFQALGATRALPSSNRRASPPRSVCRETTFIGSLESELRETPARATCRRRRRTFSPARLHNGRLARGARGSVSRPADFASSSPAAIQNGELLNRVGLGWGPKPFFKEIWVATRFVEATQRRSDARCF
jgi:hypothetical protein